MSPLLPPQGLEGLDYAYGQHPLYDPSPGWVDRLEQAIATDRPSALGELGVDRQAGPDQLEVLAAQLQLGHGERLPLIVHLVGDGGALLASLREHTSGVMLCTAAAVDRHALRRGGRPACTSRSGRRSVRTVARAVPDHLLLLESDAEHEGQRPWDTLPALYGAAARQEARFGLDQGAHF